MKFPSTLLLLFIAFSSTAQAIIEPCKFGQPLVDALQADYTPSNPLGYGPARDILYSEIDNNGLELSGIYTGFTVTLDPNEDPSISAFQNGNGLNAEHVYPQSLGASGEPAKSDLHNIFPSKVNVNEVRGNCAYNEIVDTDTDNWFYLDMQTSSIPLTEIEKYSEKDQEDCFFEPREEVKGDIARAMIYFYSIYQNIADNINPTYFSNQKAILYQWHLSDPVDLVERTRDSLIALRQGNRNPFILDSTLVRRAYFEADASYPEGDPNCYDGITALADLNKESGFSIAANLVQNELTIYAKNKQGHFVIYDLQGRLLQQGVVNREAQLSLDNLISACYILHVYSEDSSAVFRFFKQ